MRLVVSLVAAAALAVSAGTAAPASSSGFRGTVSVIGPAMRARMTGVSWHPGCPVSIGQLRLLGSIEADNTSAFNCRAATGSTHWSEHAYGHAVDVDPIENLYVDSGQTSHAASRPYLDRSRHRPGMAYPGGVLVLAFAAAGWGWGGSWSGSVHDYQHFSLSGR
jgi:hypothetical protein